MLIILPNGDISYCEHHIDNIPIANINNFDLEKFNQEAIALLRTKQKSIKENCDQCWRYPICTKIFNCSAKDGFCNDIILAKDEFLITDQLQRLYNKYGKQIDN